MKRQLRHRQLRALCRRVALLGALLAAGAPPLRAQRSTPPLLTPLAPDARLSVVPRLEMPRSGAADDAKWTLADGWPMIVEGAIAGAVVGGCLGASARGRGSLRRVGSGAGVGAVIGAAAGTGMYVLLWLGRPKHLTT